MRRTSAVRTESKVGSSPETVIIADYDPAWSHTFKVLRSRLAQSLGKLPVEIEHVGSTSIPGAAAKPVIDIDIVVRSKVSAVRAIRLLSRAGYHHKGDRGVPGREAFDNPTGLPAHHLYVVVSGNSEHLRHMKFRDFLREHPEETQKYSELKKSLARKYRDDRNAYTEAKTEFIEGILSKSVSRTQSLRNPNVFG